MNKKHLLMTIVALALSGCAASGKPKEHLIKEKLSVEEAALVHPAHIPKGLMLITSVGDLNTYGFAFGYAGSVYVPPGEYVLSVELSFDFAIQDFGGPAWTIPDDQKCYPLDGINRKDFILVQKGYSSPLAQLEGGKAYQVRFGFDRRDNQEPVPCTWVEVLPNNSNLEKQDV
ncbi:MULTISPECIES: hypothetical protein [unclassified Pseudoalteromonas]|uniref:hypothetical protein n=1 Tax=unclassified Pseudoalteromonas TaxID=194690 RepID=UPI002097E0EF|nr:hypothetical protein [Pseudoalteromonas sp. XMcav2-N]MCO7191045.1 hypothetical protein [Pseudoalteromonas sp. XMcav2-N]